MHLGRETRDFLWLVMRRVDGCVLVKLNSQVSCVLQIVNS
jgi:hypothetical protein